MQVGSTDITFLYKTSSTPTEYITTEKFFYNHVCIKTRMLPITICKAMDKPISL